MDFHEYFKKYIYIYTKRQKKYRKIFGKTDGRNGSARISTIFEEDEKQKNFTLCPDLKIQQYGLFGQYLFNNKKYSYKAAFIQNEKQVKSAGSIIAGMGVYISSIDSDSSFVYKGKNFLDNFQFGFSGGYAYTWVISPRWYIAGSATVGINFGSEKVSKFGKQKLEVYPTVFPRFAAGYNHSDWSLGLFFVSNILSPYHADKSSISLMSGNFQLKFTKRFDIIPLFSKK